jgi:predicted glutamine amidotransferase
MCIAILNNGKKLSRQELSNCWVSNDDGAGLLYVDNGVLKAFKQPNHDGFNVAGADFNKFVKEYDRVYAMSQHSKMPVLLHFRIATHGLDPAYLHPFFVSDNVGLIHNGIIYGYGTRDVSDTAEFANELATLPDTMTHNVDFLDNPFISNSILDKLESSNKVVFMDNTGEYRIFNAQLGHWSKGNWFSNDAYKTRKTYYGSLEKKSTPGTQVKSQAYYDTQFDWDAIEESEWNKSFGVNDDWYGHGKAAAKTTDPLWDMPYIDDKTYACHTCASETFVNEDSCCLVCQSYIAEAESDVVDKMLAEDDKRMTFMH